MPESTGTGGPHSRHLRRPGTEHLHHGPGPMSAIVVGGALGTLARYGVARALVADNAGFPWATLAVNVTGSFVLGLAVTAIVVRWPGDRWLRPLVAVGFCGGFTTFSTFALELDQRARAGHIALAVVYLTVTLVAGVAAALAGTALARVRTPQGINPDAPDPDLLAGDDPTGRGGSGGPS